MSRCYLISRDFTRFPLIYGDFCDLYWFLRFVLISQDFYDFSGFLRFLRISMISRDFSRFALISPDLPWFLMIFVILRDSFWFLWFCMISRDFRWRCTRFRGVIYPSPIWNTLLSIVSQLGVVNYPTNTNSCSMINTGCPRKLSMF